MSAILNESTDTFILHEIETHPAWIGCVSGLKAEKMLRGKKTPYLYVLRAGEFRGEVATDYYVTFVLPDLTIKHQPFIITINEQGWYYENTGGGGPYTNASIEDVLFMIMHCERGQNIPFTGFDNE